eukprot:NODE_237_length_11991_cov_1.642899.p9 type:complete len:176 gc:universal NODE_237_length_11991_cov_1.642899:3546-4073(+)
MMQKFLHRILRGQLFIGNLPYTATAEQIQQLINVPVTDVHLPKTTDGKSKGISFVQLKNDADVDVVIQRNKESQLQLEGRQLFIQIANERKRSVSKPSLKLYVGNLPYDTTKEDLSGHFPNCLDINLITRQSGEFLGFGYVTYGTQELATAAYQEHADKLIIKERKIRIDYDNKP